MFLIFNIKVIKTQFVIQVEIYKEHYNKTILSSVDQIDANVLIDLIMPHKYTIEQVNILFNL